MDISDCRFRIAEFCEWLIRNLMEDNMLAKATKSRLATCLNLEYASKIRSLQCSRAPLLQNAHTHGKYPRLSLGVL